MSDTEPHPVSYFQCPEVCRVALKGFFTIAQKWQLDDPEMAILLGCQVQDLEGLRLNISQILDTDMLYRISNLLGIYRELRGLFDAEERANQWIRKPNSAALFQNKSALDYMLNGQLSDIVNVREYLSEAAGHIGL
ncbi:MAG TPA: MbcA/ParS/Xre antitoxin family protein [Pseudomonadales bacterium]|nr:MbcA/ParS/Xre antitoxin family protein [Pseudomonadales bacterium]